MGFGILFIGYFLLLNVTNYPATDAIAGLVMSLALTKLARINRGFSDARISSLALSVLGIFELFLFILSTFVSEIEAFYSSIYGGVAVARCVVLALLSLLICRGIHEVAREVELKQLALRARSLGIFSLVVYLLWMLLELPLASLLSPSVTATAYAVAILLVLMHIIMMLVTIYSAYMRICMPGDENGKKKAPSRFAFVNEYRARKEEREREEEEYRRAKMNARKGRKKK